ncbi:MAG: hypothetical protein ACI4EY_08060 [Lachnospiraceae bacterium]
MFTERPVKDALKDYIKGKKVIVVSEFDDGSLDIQKIEDILPQDNFHYLVDVPAVSNPDFEQAVRNMIMNSDVSVSVEDVADQEPIESKTEESDSMEPSDGGILPPPSRRRNWRKKR